MSHTRADEPRGRHARCMAVACPRDAPRCAAPWSRGRLPSRSRSRPFSCCSSVIVIRPARRTASTRRSAEARRTEAADGRSARLGRSRARPPRRRASASSASRKMSPTSLLELPADQRDADTLISPGTVSTVCPPRSRRVMVPVIRAGLPGDRELEVGTSETSTRSRAARSRSRRRRTAGRTRGSARLLDLVDNHKVTPSRSPRRPTAAQHLLVRTDLLAERRVGEHRGTTARGGGVRPSRGENHGAH